jgi:pyridoxamine 5'-phosphate oxidase
MAIDNTVLQNLREDYRLRSFGMEDALENPFDQFQSWFSEALNAQVKEPNAMVLATSSSDGWPNARVVLLKGFDANGFVFYTNYESAKGKELTENPRATLVFNWLDLQRQVRICGHVQRTDSQTNTAYFQSRPKASQIGAWASPQSEVVADRKVLEDAQQSIAAEYAEVDKLPLPEHWGGFCLQPFWIEFWQGRRSRLHDRIRYDISNYGWERVRLAP